jgi:hypothetical protein
VWLAVSPVLLVGILAAHGLAYRLTGTPAGPAHEYLEHAPLALLALASVALLTAGLGPPLRAPAAWRLAAAGLFAFAALEHAERLVHAGELSTVATSPAFVVGLLLQLPFALLAWALARTLLRALGELPARPRRLPRHLLAVRPAQTADVATQTGRPLPGRGPPRLRFCA